MFLQIGMLRLW